MRPGVQEKSSRDLVIITKYFLPVNVVDTIAVYDLCEKLLRKYIDLKIHIVTSDLKYKSDVKLKSFESRIVNSLVIHQVKNVSFSSNNGLLRIIREILCGIRLVLYAKKLKVKTIISLSNPPLINIWNSLILWNRRYVYWSFDLYPEALFSDGILKLNSILGKFIKYVTYLRAPSYIIALGPKQFAYLLSQYENKNIGEILLPCGIHQVLPAINKPNWSRGHKIIIGYIGNLGKAHSKDFLISVIRKISFFKNILLVIAIYGEYAEEVLSFLADYNSEDNIKILSHVEQTELAFIDVHLVSLCHNWTNVSVPSKAVSAVCSNAALWLNCSYDSDTFHFFEKCSYYSSSDEISVQSVLSSISELDVFNKKCESKRIANELILLEDKSIDLINSIILK